MKKQYIKPSVEEIKVAAVSMLAASSFGTHDDTALDTSEDGVQFGRDDRPSNPNLWDSQW